MSPSLRAMGAWLYRRAENVLALMLATMFFAFLVQVFFRYVLSWPSGWSSELSSVLWIWIVLWGAAFVVREEEEMRFDLLLSAAGPRVRGAMFLITAVSIVLLYGISFPAVVDYVTFMKVEKASYLGVRMDETSNQQAGRQSARPIHTKDSTVEIWVVPTDEGHVAASEAAALVLPD